MRAERVLERVRCAASSRSRRRARRRARRRKRVLERVVARHVANGSDARRDAPARVATAHRDAMRARRALDRVRAALRRAASSRAPVDASDAYSASLRARAEAAKRVGRTRGEASSERVAMTMGADGTAPRFYERVDARERDARDGTWRVELDGARAANAGSETSTRSRRRRSARAVASGVGGAGRARGAVYDAADVAERDGDRSHGRRGDATGARGDAAETLWHGRERGCGARTRGRRRGRARAHDRRSWRGRTREFGPTETSDSIFGPGDEREDGGDAAEAVARDVRVGADVRVRAERGDEVVVDRFEGAERRVDGGRSHRGGARGGGGADRGVGVSRGRARSRSVGYSRQGRRAGRADEAEARPGEGTERRG